jgi:hypothetical protein
VVKTYFCQCASVNYANQKWQWAKQAVARGAHTAKEPSLAASSELELELIEVTSGESPRIEGFMKKKNASGLGRWPKRYFLLDAV